MLFKSLILLQLAFACQAENDVIRDGFKVKHAWSGALSNVENFFDIGCDTYFAGELGYVEVPYTSNHGFELTMRCYQSDVRVCPLYDKAGRIAGLQIAIPEKDLEGTPFDVGSKMKLKTILGQTYWTTAHYIVSPDTIKKGAGGRQNRILDTVDEIWIENGKELMNIPLDETQLAEKTLYKKQNCIPNMGTHYYYNVSADMDCHDFQPYFVLVKNHQVIGLGFSIYGKTPEHDRHWFETPPARAAEMIIPSGPPCLESWSNTYGVIALHMYYLNEPWKITCSDGDSLQPMSIVEKFLLTSYRYTSKVVDGAKKVYKDLTS